MKKFEGIRPIEEVEKMSKELNIEEGDKFIVHNGVTAGLYRLPDLHEVEMKHIDEDGDILFADGDGYDYYLLSQSFIECKG